MLTDIEIARAAARKNIAEIAARLDIGAGDILPYGHDKAKISRDFIAGLDGAHAPKRVVVLEALPLRPSGKVDRREVARLLAATTTDVTSEPSTPEP